MAEENSGGRWKGDKLEVDLETVDYVYDDEEVR